MTTTLGSWGSFQDTRAVSSSIRLTRTAVGGWRGAAQRNHIHNKQHALKKKMWGEICNYYRTLPLSSPTHTHTAAYSSLHHYLQAESDNKQQNSRDSTSGPHEDARQTHSECLDPDSEPSRSVGFCGRTTRYIMCI